MNVLYMVLVYMVGLVVGLTIGFIALKKKEDEVQQAWSNGVKQGEAFGVSRLDGWRVIGHAAFRDYFRYELAGSTVAEAISHIQHAGLKQLMLDVREYCRYNVHSRDVASVVIELVELYDRPMVIDGVTFSRYAPIPNDEVYMAIYHKDECLTPCANPCGKVIPGCTGLTY